MILVDKARWPQCGKRFCHMVSTVSVEDLHRFARAIGVRRCWFENRRGAYFPHYDLDDAFRAAALRYGAVEAASPALVAHVAVRRWPCPHFQARRESMRRRYPLPPEVSHAAS